MKIFLAICFSLMMSVVVAQQQDVQELLERETVVLYELQEQRTQKVYDLQTKGIDPKSDFELIELDSQIKAQATKVKTLKKQVKRLDKEAAKAERERQKALAAQQNPNVPAASGRPAPTVPPVPTKTISPLKSAKKELKALKKREKELVNKALSEGRNPQNASEVLQASEAVQLKEAEIAQLENQVPSVGNPSVSTPPPSRPVTSTPPPPAPKKKKIPSIGKADPRLKQAKKELKALKKQQKEVVNQALMQGRNPQTAPEVVRVSNAVTAKQNEILALQNGSAPATPSTPQQAIVDQKPQQPIAFETTPTSQPSTETVTASPIPTIGLSTILFQKFSTAIDPSYDLYLNYVAKQMLENPNLLISVNAYTDNSEKQRISMQLTAGMASSVRQALVSRGINPNRIILNPQGSKNAIGDNKTLLGQSRNRRVELRFTTMSS
ncbi:MAG: OmpA family protein [Saprospiraceae bacterium]|nr:OmpA family protein [Saprospiraceae bacterium]